MAQVDSIATQAHLADVGDDGIESRHDLTLNLNLPRFRLQPLRRLRAALILRPVGLFELGRAQIAQRRVDTDAIVDHPDVLEKVQRRLVARGVDLRVHAHP